MHSTRPLAYQPGHPILAGTSPSWPARSFYNCFGLLSLPPKCFSLWNKRWTSASQESPSGVCSISLALKKHFNVLCITIIFSFHLKTLQPSKPRKELTAATTDYQGEGSLISDAQWSTTRPMMLGVTSGTTLKIFDLLVGETPVASITHEHLVTKLAFNKSG